MAPPYDNRDTKIALPHLDACHVRRFGPPAAASESWSHFGSPSDHLLDASRATVTSGRPENAAP